MRPTVVIIDADTTTQQALRALLASLDVEINIYDSAEKYLAQVPRANGQAPACLIADVSLPGMSGLELLQRIRAVDREIPVVLLALEGEVPVAVEAMRYGATDFIEKQQLDVALLRRVSELLRSGTQSETRDASRATRSTL
jgi:FixJ family two-component response regulator